MTNARNPDKATRLGHSQRMDIDKDLDALLRQHLEDYDEIYLVSAGPNQATHLVKPVRWRLVRNPSQPTINLITLTQDR